MLVLIGTEKTTENLDGSNCFNEDNPTDITQITVVPKVSHFKCLNHDLKRLWLEIFHLCFFSIKDLTLSAVPYSRAIWHTA
jgi:hypothetical protein